MDTNTQPSANVPLPQKNHTKEIIFALIIVAVAIGAGAMIYKQARQQTQIEMQESVSQDPVRQAIEIQSSSDEIADIEADLSATDIDSLDQE